MSEIPGEYYGTIDLHTKILIYFPDMFELFYHFHEIWTMESKNFE